MKNSLLFMIFILFLSSCSSYVNRIHEQLDIDEKNSKPVVVDKFGVFRQKESMLGSNNTKILLPPVERQYLEENQKKRYAASDLNDTSTEGSLWSGNGQENFFFSKNKARNLGDIILLKVKDNLKREIQLELMRNFPQPQNMAKKEDQGADKKQVAPPNEQKTISKEEKQSPTYDHISCVITEELDKEHLMIKGRKDILYNNRKRLIEVVALITTRDIQEDDTIDSNYSVESLVSVLR